MRKVWLAQCLCGSLHRHTILATAGLADGREEAIKTVLLPLKESVVQAATTRLINPWCGLCRLGMESWIYEVRSSQWTTMEEALPMLKEAE